MKVMKDITLKKGVPSVYYLDKAGSFGKDDVEQTCTQIGRALDQLDCNIVLAS
ncbi:MAG: hypothetical protein HQK52_23430, partial [Oligoflexia bacterium]|nr:hypothetical protein [Oligoflexia bacterium]